MLLKTQESKLKKLMILKKYLRKKQHMLKFVLHFMGGMRVCKTVRQQ